MCDAQCPDVLQCNNDKILQYLNELRRQRDDVVHTIRKQEEEKAELALESERLAYKMNILAKSLAQRMVTRDRYNESIVEAEEYYDKLVKSSEALLNAVQKDFQELYESMDKKVGPDIKGASEAIGNKYNIGPNACGHNVDSNVNFCVKMGNQHCNVSNTIGI